MRNYFFASGRLGTVYGGKHKDIFLLTPSFMVSIKNKSVGFCWFSFYIYLSLKGFKIKRKYGNK